MTCHFRLLSAVTNKPTHSLILCVNHPNRIICKPPIKKIWHKSYLKSYKGSENLIGILEGYYNDQTKQITILMMAVKPAFRRKGINGKMVKFAKDFFKVKKENIIFDKPTKSGESFKESGKYSKGGKVKREIWVRFNLGAGKHFGWWQVENKETKEKNYYNPETTQLTLTNCKLTKLTFKLLQCI